MTNQSDDSMKSNEIYRILLDMHKDFGKNQKEMGVLQGKVDKVLSDQASIKMEIQNVEHKVESLQMFRNKMLGVASVVSMVMGFVMSIVVNLVTRKFT